MTIPVREPAPHARSRPRGRPAFRNGVTALLACATSLAALQSGCRGGEDADGRGAAGAASAEAPASPPSTPTGATSSAHPPDTGASEDELAEARLARTSLASAGIPLYPGAQGLDATTFESNGSPYVSIDFFSLDPPGKVAAFYDERLTHLTARRDTLTEPGSVRYHLRQPQSGLAVRPWDGKGADNKALLLRFDRRDAQGVSSAELDAYGQFLTRARSHVVIKIVRPEGSDAAGAPSARQDLVARRGARVMPFDLDRTTHTFEPLERGGVQTVVADAPADSGEVQLVRRHVREEARRFARGDFADPSAVHGEEMPGLAALRGSAGRIDVRYEELPAGGRIRYTTDDRELVEALHTWFRAQVSDHGAHAQH